MDIQLDFDKLWDYDHPDVTEGKFQEVLARAGDAGAEYRLQLLTQIARAQGLQRKFEEAHTTLDQVKMELSDDIPIAHIRYCLERGRAFNSGGDRGKARPCFVQAMELAQANGADYYAIDAIHMLAIVDPPEESLIWNLQAVEMAQKSGSPRAQHWLGSLYNNMGWTYHDQGHYEQALTLFEKAVEWQQANGDQGKLHIARWCVARTLRSLNRIPEALEILWSLAQAGSDDGFVDEELGECLLLEGKPDEAQPYFGQAYHKLSQNPQLMESEPGRIQRLGELGGRL